MKRPTSISQEGLQHLANSSLAICGLARDCGSKLKENIRFIENLRTYFKETIVIVVENGSKDDTRLKLDNWVSSSDNIIVLNGEESNIDPNLPSPIPGIPNPYYSRKRISRMAALRNQYLDYLASLNKSFDYLLVMDFDVDRISLEGVLNSLFRANEWDVVTAFGYSLSPKLKERYHDTYALVPLGEKVNAQTELSIKALQSTWRLNKNDQNLIPVYAAYGGLSIYKYELIKQIRYQILVNNDERVEVRMLRGPPGR